MKTAALERRARWLLGLAVLVLALSLRVHVVTHTVIDRPVRADAADYLAYALNLQRYGVYSRDHAAVAAAADAAPPRPDAVRTPGYPLFLAALLRGDGDAARAFGRVQFVQAVLDSLAAALFALLAAYLLGLPAGLAVGALCALSPHLVNMNVYLLSETLFTALLAVAVAMLCGAGPATPRRWLLAGFALGAATLTRPWPLLLAPLFATVTVLGQRGAPAAWRAAGLLLLGCALVYLPWPLRNLVTLGTSGDPTLVINGLQHGMYPGFVFDGHPESYGFPYRFDPATPAISQSVGHALAAIAERFTTRPAEHLAWYLWGKPLALLSWSTVQGVERIFIYPALASPYLEAGLARSSATLMQLLHAPLMVLAVTGTALAALPARLQCLPAKQLHGVRCLALLMVYFVAVHVVTAPFPRYAIPMRPVCYVLAAYAAVSLLARVRARLRRTR
ncbi:MAG: hypothetical protein AB7Q81_15500 [Gammaproteobacteria bacterium]